MNLSKSIDETHKYYIGMISIEAIAVCRAVCDKSLGCVYLGTFVYIQ